ncbi:tigger transposable element-derived protein 4 [Sceloporus undulatus]|uniref:tigger transposable element-derived protein 4 n=1 Tax=Sceloporus undulatus TaxID=8520 RepID=UPI001C4AB794|nr:tigger transposable element-derived protein 4 [Sceloporus undulatus]
MHLSLPKSSDYRMAEPSDVPTLSPVARKKTSLTIQDKIAIITTIENGKKTEIAEKYGIKRNSLYSIMKNKDNILEAFESLPFDPKRKRLRMAHYTDLEEALVKWYQMAQCSNVRINGPLLRIKANYFAEKLGHHDFKCSNGWLDRFKSRYGLAFRSQSVAANATTLTTVTTVDALTVWHQSILPYYLKIYQPNDIFNMKETRLFYQMVPSHTFVFKGETCSVGKVSKEKITLVVGANMDASEKLPLLVIGKNKTPYSFQSTKSPLVKYQSSAMPWKTSDMFEQWLSKLDMKFQTQKRHVVIFVDPFPDFPEVKNLKCIRLVCFPSCSPSRFAAMKHGIIKNLKIRYRSLLFKKFIDCVDSGKEFSVTLLNALDMLQLCWRAVSSGTIINSYIEAGFKSGSGEKADVDAEVEISFSLTAYALAAGVQFPTVLSLEEYAALDDDLITCEMTPNSEIQCNQNFISSQICGEHEGSGFSQPPSQNTRPGLL